MRDSLLTAEFGHALWLALDPDTHTSAQGMIDALAASYKGPRFSPHVTLCAHIGEAERAESLARSLARSTRAFDVQFKATETGPVPFRALTLIPQAPEPFERLRGEADRLLGPLHKREPFHPHLSLFYGGLDTPDLERAARFVTLPLTGRIVALEVWRLSGYVDTWTRLHAFALSG